MTRKEIKKFLEGQLKYLKEQHVEDLMKAGRIQELKNIVKVLDYSLVYDFCANQKLAIQASEIPKEYLYEVVLYVSNSKMEDNEWFEDYSDFIEMLMEKGEVLAKQIAASMGIDDLCNYTIEDLLLGIWNHKVSKE